MIFPLRSLLSGFFGSVQMPGLAVFVRNCAAAIIPKIHLIGGLAEQMGWNSADTYLSGLRAIGKKRPFVAASLLHRIVAIVRNFIVRRKA